MYGIKLISFHGMKINEWVWNGDLEIEKNVGCKRIEELNFSDLQSKLMHLRSKNLDAIYEIGVIE